MRKRRSHHPPFFRYVVIARGIRYRHGRKRIMRSVQGVFFSTSIREIGRFKYMWKKVIDIAQRAPSVERVETGETFAEPVTRYETHGIGLWRIGILVDDQPERNFWEWLKGKFRLG